MSTRIATKEELNQFIQMYIRSMITQMKHDEKVHKDNLEKQKIAAKISPRM
jgi:uncharacterized protein YpmS